MKKLILLFCTVAFLIGCQKEQIEEEITSNKGLEISDTEKYFGVFVSDDLELHGEIRVKKVKESQYEATVELLNSEILKFKGAIKNLANDIEFTGKRGSFIINFTDKNNMTSSQFKIDGKNGIVKTYADNRGGAIVFGTYAQDGVPSFIGTWDMITLGTPEPGHPGFFMIDDIFIFHKDTHSLSDTTAGMFEPFFEPCFFAEPFMGGATDGFLVVGIDQVAFIAGAPGVWSMVSDVGISLDPFTCAPLPPGIDGFWDWGGKTGTITRVFI